MPLAYMVTRFPLGKLEPPPEILPSVSTLNNPIHDLTSPRTIVTSVEIEVVTPISAQRRNDICDSPYTVVKEVASLHKATKDPPS